MSTYFLNISFRLHYLVLVVFNLILFFDQTIKAKENSSSFNSNLGDLVAFSDSDFSIKTINPVTKNVIDNSGHIRVTKKEQPSETSSPLLSASTQDSNLSNYITDEELNKLLFDDLNFETDEKEESKIEVLKSQSWLPSISASIGFGFSDNPMYGPYIRESSGYTELETESFIMRQGDPDYLSYVYFYGEGKRFFDLTDYKLSGILLLQGEHSYKPKKSNTSFGLKLRHTYYDQAFDFSDLALPFSMQIISNKSEVIPHFGYQINSVTKVSIEASRGEEKYDLSSENNEDQKVQATLKYNQNENYEWKGKIFNRWVQYDERLKKNPDGTTLNNERLNLSKLGTSLSVQRESNYKWIRSVEFEIRYEDLFDNAGGYYDYGKISAKLSHQMKFGNWNIETELGWSDYQYDLRETSSGQTFDRKSNSLDFLVTRKFNTRWDAYLKWRFEEDHSNSRDYEYFSNFWSIGINWAQ